MRKDDRDCPYRSGLWVAAFTQYTAEMEAGGNLGPKRLASAFCS